MCDAGQRHKEREEGSQGTLRKGAEEIFKVLAVCVGPGEPCVGRRAEPCQASLSH